MKKKSTFSSFQYFNMPSHIDKTTCYKYKSVSSVFFLCEKHVDNRFSIGAQTRKEVAFARMRARYKAHETEVGQSSAETLQSLLKAKGASR